MPELPRARETKSVSVERSGELARGDATPIGTLKAMIEDIGWFEADLRRLGLAR